MMASLDIYRPAAQEQLIKLGQDNEISTLETQSDKKPLQIAKLAYQKAKDLNFDVLILDSAGRNHIDILIQEFADPTSSMNQQVRTQMGIL